MFSDEEKRVTRKFLIWFESLVQQDAEIFMRLMGKFIKEQVESK